MTKNKKLGYLAIALAAVVLLPILVVCVLNLLAWGGIFVGGWFSPDPPAPAVTYAEFPFEIVYELEGETVTVRDVYVCAFDGFGWNEGIGKHRAWRGYLKSTGEERLILLTDGDLALACAVGYPAYYMSDPKMAEEPYTPYIYYIKADDRGGTTTGISNIEALLEEHQIKLTHWQLSSPVENTFE